MKVAIFDSVTVKINKVFMWSDSKTVLQYIRNENVKYPTYVMHRVSEIKKNTDVSSWNYIPVVLNVADDATRVTNFQNLNEHCRWFNGPEFLVNDESEWPKETFDKSVENASTSINQVNISPQYQSFINWNYYSSFYKLTYHVASLLKLKRHWTKRHRNQPSNVNFNIFTVKEIEESLNVIVCESQKEYYPRESNSLPMTKLVSKDSKLLSLHPLLIDNITRVGGRNKHANVPFNQRHQMIIHKNHPLSKLIIKHIHVSNFHCGREQTLSILRNKYWIPNVRGLIRKIITDCLHCRKVSATPSPPFMADIPEERLVLIILDHFTSNYQKPQDQTLQKGGDYRVIFTCITTRAVHLEISNDLSTDSFILSLKRFIARRVQVKRLMSDNGTNFIGAERELRETLNGIDQNRITNFLSQHSIDWKFNPPSSPWMGGIWEALIISVKRALKVVIQDRLFTDETLATLMCEVESILN